MKYPAEQYKQLVSGIQELSTILDVTAINPSALHFLVYQQGSLGQTHNWIYRKGSEIARAHAITDMLDWHKVVTSVPESFEIYPEGCNDNHVETAVKKAVKEITRSNAAN
jgi:hypothetical protein